MFAFAGLYDEFKGADGETTSSYTIITTEANECSREFHHRMPVILPKEAESEWIDHQAGDGHAVEHLLRSFPSDQMTAYPVSIDVNNVRNNNSHLIEPIEHEDSGDDRKTNEEDGKKAQPSLF